MPNEDAGKELAPILCCHCKKPLMANQATKIVGRRVFHRGCHLRHKVELKQRNEAYLERKKADGFVPSQTCHSCVHWLTPVSLTKRICLVREVVTDHAHVCDELEFKTEDSLEAAVQEFADRPEEIGDLIDSGQLKDREGDDVDG